MPPDQRYNERTAKLLLTLGADTTSKFCGQDAFEQAKSNGVDVGYRANY